MRTVLPISVSGPGAELHQAVERLLVRVAQMARKRNSPIDITISPASVGVVAAFDGFYTGKLTLEETCQKIDKAAS